MLLLLHTCIVHLYVSDNQVPAASLPFGGVGERVNRLLLDDRSKPDPLLPTARLGHRLTLKPFR